MFTCGTLTYVLKLQWLVKTYTPNQIPGYDPEQNMEYLSWKKAVFYTLWLHVIILIINLHYIDIYLYKWTEYMQLCNRCDLNAQHTILSIRRQLRENVTALDVSVSIHCYSAVIVSALFGNKLIYKGKKEASLQSSISLRT